MEKLLNFYITLLAGFASAKSDSFYLRIYHQTLLNNITTSLRANKQLNGNFRKNYYQLYNTNTQYYEKIYEGIKNNKKKITFHYNTIDTQLIPKGIIGMFQEHFIATILQEINPRETKLYIKKLILLQEFKAIFGKRISVFLKKDTNSFIEIVYEDLSKLLSTPELIIHELKKQLNENNIFNLKENLYTIDFRIWREILQTLHNTTITNLDNSTIIGITAILRETTLGIILLIQYMKKQQYSHLIPTMMEIYTQNILGIPEGIAAQMKNSILTIREKYSPIFNLRIHLDDNKEFLDIAMKHISILEKKNPEQRTQLTNEHILWMKGLLHTLSMYNKRYLLPK